MNMKKPNRISHKSEKSLNRRKVIVIGLDGATLDLILPWVNKGLLPNFQKIVRNGVWGHLTSTIPPFTAPAWTSFMTGKNPGKHGIYDFMVRKPASYSTMSVNASFCDSDSLWRIISSAGKKTGVINVPMTYPPEEVNGFLVSGMLTPSNADIFSYPPSLSQEIRQLFGNFPELPLEIYHPRGKEKELIGAAEQFTGTRIKVADHMMNNSDWDFFMVVFRATDILQHWLWKYMDESHSLHEAEMDSYLKEGILRIYVQLDDYIGGILDRIDDNILMIMSDHGAGPLEKYIYINTWLLSKGYIKLKKGFVSVAKRILFRLGLSPIWLYDILMRFGLGKKISKTVKEHKGRLRGLMNRMFLSFEDVDWERTRAFSIGNLGPIYINVKGRDPKGIIPEGSEYKKLVKDLVDRLSGLKDPDSGEYVMQGVYSREEIYEGAHLNDAPDVVFLPRRKYYALGQHNFPSNSWLERTRVKTGCHTMNGVVMMIGEGVRRGKEIKGARIIDLSPTILASLGISIPDDMDGSFLREAFSQDFLKENPVTYSKANSDKERRRIEFSDKEERQIKDRLKDLGYI
jgi:predicted AlkP superfamily phosphohydrolase/phosphomutase